MKKKIVGILLAMILVFAFAGCEKETVEEKAKISIDCSMVDPMYGGDYGNDLTAVAYLKANFNEEGYLVDAEYTTVETSATDEIYKERKAEFTSSEGKTTDDNATFDDAKRTVTITMTDKPDYSLFSEEEKKNLYVVNHVKSAEERGYKCEIKGATRESLGL